jgi:MFS family permease
VISERLRSAGNNTFRSLRVRNYRLYFEGQLISICGTWMQTIAQALLVLDLTKNNGVAAGLTIAIQFIPTLCLGAFAGVVADRFDKRRLMMLTQALMAFNALVLAGLALADVAKLWMVYAVVFANGVVTVLDLPLRQSFVSEMVDDEDLPNAVALNSAVFNSSRIVGPTLAAIVLVFAGKGVRGKGVCFLFNAVSYLAVIVCLARMRKEELNQPERIQRAKGQVREGIRYTWRHRQVRYVVALVGVFGAMAFTFNVTLPLMARIIFHNEKSFSAMTVSMGLGSLIGALVTAARKEPSVKLLIAAGFLFSAMNMLAAASPQVVLMLPALALMGFGSITFLSTANSLVQLSVSGPMRGRVMALYSMVLLGGTPAGNLIAGWVANRFSPRWAVAMGGMGTLVGLLFLGPRVRQPAVIEGDDEIIDDESVADEATVIGN